MSSDRAGVARRALLLLVLLFVAPITAHAETWSSEATGGSVPIEIILPQGEAPHRAVIRPIGLHPGGGASRAALLGRSFAVIELDYRGKVLSPHAINRDLLKLRRDAVRLLAPRGIDPDRLYVVPESHDLAVDVPFHTNGGFTYRMDVVFPAAHRVPAILQVSHRVEHRRANHAFTGYRDTLLDALALTGYAIALADHHGAAIPDSRLDRMPLHVEHGHAALAALARQPVDASRIAMVGFSKGGTSAALIAGTLGEGPPRLACTVVLSAYLDQRRLREDGIDQRSLRWRDSLAAWGDPDANPDVWDKASAITYVSEGDPPMLLMAGSDDDYRPAQSRRMAAALQRAGVPHELLIEPGLGHNVTLDPAALARIHAFIARQFEAVSISR